MSCCTKAWRVVTVHTDGRVELNPTWKEWGETSATAKASRRMPVILDLPNLIVRESNGIDGGPTSTYQIFFAEDG